jgi:hypothetical protein
LTYSSENHSISEAENISDDFNFDIGEWALDENGNVVHIPSIEQPRLEEGEDS